MGERVSQVLADAEAYVLNSPEGKLSWGWRIRLWHAMNAEVPEALFRRQVLAYVIAARTLPEWDRIRDQVDAEYREWPDQMLHNCREVILGRQSYEQATGVYHHEDACNLLAEGDVLGGALACPLTVRAAIECASSDEEARYEELCYSEIDDPDFLLQWDTDDPADADAWDTHHFGSIVAAWINSDPESVGKRRAYWLKWLREDIPLILGPIERVRALLFEVGPPAS